MAEEFGVEGGAEDGWDGVGHAGVEGLPDEMDEVRGMGFDTLGGEVGIVGLLVGHVDVRAGDGPVAMTAGPALLVEVEVVAVAGIAEVAGPDLDAGGGVAGEDCGRVRLFFRGVGAVDVVGLVEAAVAAVSHRLVVVTSAAEEGLVGRGDACGLLDEVGVDDEEVNVGFAEGLLDAYAVEGGSDGGAVGVGDGVVPEAGGTVTALGRPDAAGMLAEMALVGGDGGADLGADALVGAEQGQVAVGGAAGDDVDEAKVVEVAEAFDDVAVEGFEVVEGVGEVLVPETGELGVVELADGEEVGFVFAGGDDLALDVVGEVSLEDGVGELLEKDGGEVQIAMQSDSVALEIGEDSEKREVGFSGCLVEPLDAMGPGSVIDDVGEMSVEGEGEKGR